MKQYLEIYENLTPEEKRVKQPQQIRIEVSSRDEVITKLGIYEPAFAGLNYVKRYHKCYHSEGLPCEIEEL